MKTTLKTLLAATLLLGSLPMGAQEYKLWYDKKPWSNGRLMVSDNHKFLQHENGTPFFWLGDTGWLLPEKLDRSEAQFYLQKCRAANVWSTRKWS